MFKNLLPVVCLVLMRIESAYAHDYSIEDLVNANQNALNLIHKIDLLMTHTEQQFDNSKLVGSFSSSLRWAREGVLERNRYDLKVESKNSRLPLHIYDWYADANSIRMLRNWDLNKPQQITPTKQGTVKAQISPRTRGAIGLDVAEWLNWTFLSGKQARNLRELVRESPGVDNLGRSEIDGREVWQLRIKVPGEQGKPSKKSLDVFLEPMTNFHVRRVVDREEQKQVIDDETKSVPYESVRTVKRFLDFENAVVLVPVEIETRTSVGPKISVTNTQVSKLTVNQALPPDAFNFRFPADVLVKDLRSQKVVLWGTDNEPAQVITRAADLPGYVKPDLAAEEDTSTRRLWPNPILSVIVTVLGVIVLLLSYRYFKKRRGCASKT